MKEIDASVDPQAAAAGPEAGAMGAAPRDSATERAPEPSADRAHEAAAEDRPEPADYRTHASAPKQHLEEVTHASLRGIVGAMAMSGLRTITVDLGMVDQSPPDAIVRRKARGLFSHVPRKRRRAAVELVHLVYGAAGGAGFGALPASLRRRAWAGPVYGLVSLAGFELVVAPALGLGHAKNPAVAERIALTVDHLLYGLVLGEIRRRPQA